MVLEPGRVAASQRHLGGLQPAAGIQRGKLKLFPSFRRQFTLSSVRLYSICPNLAPQNFSRRNSLPYPLSIFPFSFRYLSSIPERIKLLEIYFPKNWRGEARTKPSFIEEGNVKTIFFWVSSRENMR